MFKYLLSMLLATACAHPIPTDKCADKAEYLTKVASSAGYTLVIVRPYIIPPLKQTAVLALFAHRDSSKGLLYYTVPGVVAEGLGEAIRADNFEKVAECVAGTDPFVIYRRVIEAVKGEKA